MAKRLYVGNLPFDATTDAVRAAFEAFGTVHDVSLITDRETGRSRGFGFIEMDEGDADKAIAELDGRDFGGRALRVNEAQQRQDRGGRGGRGGGGGGGRAKGRCGSDYHPSRHSRCCGQWRDSEPLPHRP